MKTESKITNNAESKTQAGETKFVFQDIHQSSKRRHLKQQVIYSLFTVIGAICILPIVGLIFYLVMRGLPGLNWEFITTHPDNGMTEGGILPAIWGTVLLVAYTLLFSIPVGVFGAIYLNEYARQNRFTRMIRLAIVNLAGVPSIVFGLFGLGIFVLTLGRFLKSFSGNNNLTIPGKIYDVPVDINQSVGMLLLTVLLLMAPKVIAGLLAWISVMFRKVNKSQTTDAFLDVSDRLYNMPRLIYWIYAAVVLVAMLPWNGNTLMAMSGKRLSLGFDASIMAGSLTLAILVLPLIITATEEALKTVPRSFREASLALGATKWTTIRKVILPNAIPGILTGIVLTIGRAAGETAAILLTVAVYSQKDMPHWYDVDKPTMALPYHLYIISTQAVNVPERIQWGTALVLLLVVLSFNIIAIFIRAYFRAKQKW